MSRQLGNYASRTQFCEVVIEITKLYVFQENKSRWKSRCLKIEKQIILYPISREDILQKQIKLQR
jgi:hypothetical protein